MTIVGLACLTTITSPAEAQDINQQISQCQNENESIGIVINACSALIHSGRFDSANLASIYVIRGDMYILTRNYVGAIADFDQAIRLNPQDTRAYFKRGNAYLRQEDHVRAIADYGHVIRLTPQDSRVYLRRGNAYLRQEDHARAIADFDHVIRLNPQSANAYFNRGVAHVQRLANRDAWNDFDVSLRLNPRDAETRYGRGMAALGLGRTEEGRSDMERAIAADAGVAQSFGLLRTTP